MAKWIAMLVCALTLTACGSMSNNRSSSGSSDQNYASGSSGSSGQNYASGASGQNDVRGSNASLNAVENNVFGGGAYAEPGPQAVAGPSL
jgi:hypothetical protein